IPVPPHHGPSEEREDAEEGQQQRHPLRELDAALFHLVFASITFCTASGTFGAATPGPIVGGFASKIPPATMYSSWCSFARPRSCSSSAFHVTRFNSGRCGCMFDMRNVSELSSAVSVRSADGQRCPRSNPERA